MSELILSLEHVAPADAPRVGGKGAGLAMLQSLSSQTGVDVAPGFVVTADAFRLYLSATGLAARLEALLATRRQGDDRQLPELCRQLQALFDAPLPLPLYSALEEALAALSRRCGVSDPPVAVRSSATAEDLPGASFAGQQESFLNVRGPTQVARAVRGAYASLYSARAMHYREDMGFDHRGVALAAVVQQLVRADTGAAGVVFTVEPESGHDGVVLVTGSVGLGESVVQGRVEPDQFLVHKAALRAGREAVFARRIGRKEQRVVVDAQAGAGVRTEPVPEPLRHQPCLTDAQVRRLASAALVVEEEASRRAGRHEPMDLEWALDGRDQRLYLLQARPETGHRSRTAAGRRWTLETDATPIVTGLAIGSSVATGRVRRLGSAAETALFRQGEVLVAETTDPDWEPVMKHAAAIVTERGGRTSHAAIVARELGVPAVVGAADACTRLPAGQPVTVSCAGGATGRVYAGALPFRVETLETQARPTRTKVLLNLADPDQAFAMAQQPADGVGLLRLEFLMAGALGVHPMALAHPERLDEMQRAAVHAAISARHGDPADGVEWFVDRLAQGVGTIAAAFHPRPVVVRLSDFKTNEYARLAGGTPFEPHEENPMLGWRGASRYHHPGYRDGFRLELTALRRVRERYGLENVELMVPFCRTPDEGRRVLELLAEEGLAGRPGAPLVRVMAELPSNILEADAFAQLFDGFSIGSNDLTQLVLGVDRDSATVAPLFDERSPSVRWCLQRLIERAHAAGREVSICGQAPSDHPELVAWLVSCGIDALSVTPDALWRTREVVAEAEAQRSP